MENKIKYLEKEIKSLKEEVKDLKYQNNKIKEEVFPNIPETDLSGNRIINQWNNAMRGSGYQATLKEEMNLDGDPNFRYVGRGSLF